MSTHDATAPEDTPEARARRLAHDLRNALGAIKNSAHLVRLRGGGDAAVLRAVGIIETQVATMVRLLEPAEASAPAPAPLPRADEAGSARAAGSAATATDSAHGLKLLLVDDSEAVRDTFAEILGDAGYAVRTAGDGDAAMAAAAEWTPDAVMLDIHIPGRNGYEVAAALREQYPREALKLVMFSGMRLDDVTLRESQRRGFDFCFDKTGDFTELDDWLRVHAAPQRSDSAA